MTTRQVIEVYGYLMKYAIKTIPVDVISEIKEVLLDSIERQALADSVMKNVKEKNNG